MFNYIQFTFIHREQNHQNLKKDTSYKKDPCPETVCLIPKRELAQEEITQTPRHMKKGR